MSTRIGIISDVHSSIQPLQSALQVFRSNNVAKIICAGDIAGYGADELDRTVSLLLESGCLLISGNHDIFEENSNLLQASVKSREMLNNLPKSLQLEIEDKRILVVHASPPDNQHGGIKLLDQDGSIIPSQLLYWQSELASSSYDILIVGHTHQVFSEVIGNTLVINPGSTLFNHSCMILSVPEMSVTTYALNGRDIIKSWNWGIFYKKTINDINL